MRSKALLGSSREVAQDCEVSFVNYLYLVLLIISQNFYTTYTTSNQNQTEPGLSQLLTGTLRCEAAVWGASRHGPKWRLDKMG